MSLESLKDIDGTQLFKKIELDNLVSSFRNLKASIVNLKDDKEEDIFRHMIQIILNIENISRVDKLVTKNAIYMRLDEYQMLDKFDASLIFENEHNLLVTSDRVLYEIPIEELDSIEKKKYTNEKDVYFFNSTIGRVPGKRVTGNDVCFSCEIGPMLLHNVKCITCGRVIQPLLRKYYGYIDHYYLEAVRNDNVKNYVVNIENIRKQEIFTYLELRLCCRNSLKPSIVSESYNRQTVALRDLNLCIYRCKVLQTIYDRDIHKCKDKEHIEKGHLKTCFTDINMSQFKNIFTKIAVLLENESQLINDLSRKKKQNSRPISTSTMRPDNFIVNQNNVLSDDESSEEEDQKDINEFPTDSSEDESDDESDNGSVNSTDDESDSGSDSN